MMAEPSALILAALGGSALLAIAGALPHCRIGG
jgi:hypothetical protein